LRSIVYQVETSKLKQINIAPRNYTRFSFSLFKPILFFNLQQKKMSTRAPSPPSTGYKIIDIRHACMPTKKPHGDHAQGDMTVRPPSPPQSSGTSEDAFNGSDLVDTILESLDKPLHHKFIPTYILYDKKGLQLFDQITQLDDEYYLTGAELDILQTKSDDIVDRLQNGSVIFELGAG
jgi:hypothetical protein